MLSRCRRATLAMVLGMTLVPGVAGAATGPASGLDSVTEKIICECGCSNLTIKNCTCGKADRVRADVAVRLSRGQTPDQVLKAYVDEYGEQILAAPTAKGFNLVGWVLPFAAVLAGAGLLIVVLRRWSRVPFSDAPLLLPLGGQPSTPPDPAFLQRVREEMENPEV
ncbi:MAG TPA: cytochrome c-type biogenesis protein CcmH [Candidatus Polarisedimenticolia bacterium]|nr:cytochrome c-type biogenesis protein CcmH [Candidatus Polarisedimenticolia bacterium]